VALRDKWTEFASVAMGFVNSVDAGNSRKEPPTAAETAQLSAKLDISKSQYPKFLTDLEIFMKEVKSNTTPPKLSVRR
jgi:hypothetical protein